MYTVIVTSIFRTLQLSCVIILIASLGAVVSVSHAQEGSNDLKQAETHPVTPAKPLSGTVVKSTEKKVSQAVLPNPKKAAKSQFDSEKEQRLEDLRYKHLWIAYSLVWVIIFVFIRQTWSRSQAVSSRLEELKARLTKLEEKGE